MLNPIHLPKAAKTALNSSLALLFAIFALGGCDLVEPQTTYLDSSAEHQQGAGDPAAAPKMGATTLYSGIRHVPMGNALLYASCQGALVIAAIGSSGLDGVCIDLSETDGAANQFRTLSPLTTDIDWTVQGFVDGSDFILWQRLKLRDSEIVLRLDGSQSPSDGVQLELLENGLIVGTQSFNSPQAAVALQGTPVLTGTSVAAFTGASAGASGIRTQIEFESSIAVELPDGSWVQVDEIGVTWPMSVDNLTWSQDFMFARAPGSSVSEVEMTGSSFVHNGKAVRGTCGSVLALPGSGGLIGTYGVAPGMTVEGLWDDTDVVRLHGVALDTPGQSFMVEISGVEAGYKTANSKAESLIINLSVGWDPNGLRVAGDYPSGDGYRLSIIRRGGVVANMTLANGQPAWPLPNAALSGLVLGAFKFNSDTYSYDAVGNLRTASGSIEPIRIRVEPVGMVSAPTPGETLLQYERLSAGAWFMGDRDEDTSTPPVQMARSR